MREWACLWAAALAILLACAAGTPAQDVTASITGTVTDQTGAVIAGATVTAKDVARGTVWTATTNDQGVYSLLRVPVGTYDIRVESPGFQAAVQPGVTLVLNQTARLDYQLKVGQVSQVVEATTAAPVLQTETTQVSTILDSRTNEALPLATRNYVQLTLLSAGSVTPNPGGFNNGDNTASGSRPYINGNREQANNFLLDGNDNNQVSDNLLGYTPSPDAIQEFNLITNNASAEFGNFQGGIVSATIKSGTNSFHGDVWEFFRNDVLNANKWENNWSGAAKNKLRWNMFGGTLGGPVIKNKLFFFVDYQGQRFDHPSSAQQITVFTAAERQGDFSQLLAQKGVQLYNPCAAGTGINNVPCSAAATRTAFANNQIPGGMISPVAQALFASSLYPTPVNTQLTNNAFNTTAQAFNADQGDARVDYNLSSKDRIFGRFSHGYQNNPTTNSVALLGTGFSTAPTYNIVGTWTHMLSNSLLNEARFGWNHVTLHNGTTFDKSVGTLGEQLGIAGSNPNGVAGLLNLAFGGGTPTNFTCGDISCIGSSEVEQNFDDKVYQLEDSLIWTHGRHTLHFGFQYWKQIINTFYSGNSGKLGGMVFGPNFTASAATNPAAKTGDGTADFFLGLPTSFGRGISTGGWEQHSNTIAGYAQDDWKVNTRLTLNLGLRYEAHTPWTEIKNRQVNFGLLTGAVEFAGQNGNSAGLYNGTYGAKDLQPRIGFAWRPEALGDRTVVRGAYTVSSYLEGTGTNLRLTLNPPFSPAEFLTQYNNVALPGSTASQGVIAPPPPSDPTCSDLSCYNGALIRLWDPNVQPAISQQWNLTVQHQFANNLTLQLGYVGQHGTHLMVPMPYAQKQSLANSACGQPPCTAPSIYIAGNPTLASKISQISGTASNGNMRYDALQAVLQKDYAHGLQYQVAYTYSKCMTNNSGYYGSWGAETTTASPYWQNIYDPKDEWAPCFYDATHVLSAYAVYDLPIGKGKAIGKDMSPAANAVVGGWSINPIVSLHTGFPLALYDFSGDPSGTGSRGQRPDCNGPAHVFGRQPISTGGFQWFDATPYSSAPTGQFGTCAPALGSLRGPGYANFDISLQKNFQITERYRVQFRTDFLNAFNKVNLNAPGTALGTTMGQITSSQDSRNIQFALKFYY